MARPGGRCPAPRSRRLRRLRLLEAFRRRLIAASALAALILHPLTAVAAPSPSPALESLLAKPPTSDYAENNDTVALHGEFDVNTYVDFLGPSDPPATQRTLNDDGMLSGFGKTWVQPASSHLLLEVVIAFKGGAGAKKWLGTNEQLDKSDSYYKRAISVSGIGSYYGVHFEDPSTPAYADVVSFVKGNDYFFVGLVSTANDLGDAASAQTQRQFDSAPPYTIPPSQWPESARALFGDPGRLATTAAYVLGGLLVLVLLAGLGAFVLVRTRRKPALQPAGGMALHVSGDGRHWWDGEAWRDVSRDVPPGALRSEDGNYWWDGAEWRLLEKPSS